VQNSGQAKNKEEKDRKNTTGKKKAETKRQKYYGVISAS